MLVRNTRVATWIGSVDCFALKLWLDDVCFRCSLVYRGFLHIGFLGVFSWSFDVVVFDLI